MSLLLSRPSPITMYLCCVAILGSAHAAELPSPPPSTKPTQQELPEIPADLVDPAFASKIDLAAVRRAIGALDANSLIDQAEKLARAEQELKRQHRSLPSSVLFDAAIRIIGEKHEEKAFERLERALKDLTVREYDLKLSALRQLLASPRKISAGPNVPLSEVTAEAIVLYNTLVEQVKVAKVAGDRSGLAGMRATVQGLDELHVKQRQHLMLLVDDAVASLPARGSVDSQGLARLSSPLYRRVGVGGR